MFLRLHREGADSEEADLAGAVAEAGGVAGAGGAAGGAGRRRRRR